MGLEEGAEVVGLELKLGLELGMAEIVGAGDPVGDALGYKKIFSHAAESRSRLCSAMLLMLYQVIPSSLPCTATAEACLVPACKILMHVTV